jgi:hypothetical protein
MRSWLIPLALAMTSAACGLLLGDLDVSLNAPPEGGVAPEGAAQDGSGPLDEAGCPTPQARCGGACVDTRSDPSHCGSCENACGSGLVCRAGACVLSCGPGLDACPDPRDAGFQFCANLATDNANCGRCSAACSPSTHCTGSMCCAAGFSGCGGQCIDTTTDPRHCGSCDLSCDGSLCSAGQCASRYTFSGVRTALPIATLVGWTECYRDLYSNTTTTLAATIQSMCTKANLVVACRAKDATVLDVAATAPRADVFFDTGTTNTTHIANGVGWYFNGNWSMGYAPAGDGVNRNQCDTLTTPDTGLRLCWHTLNTNGSGYRCGAAVALNGSSAYERLVYHAD